MWPNCSFRYIQKGSKTSTQPQIQLMKPKLTAAEEEFRALTQTSAFAMMRMNQIYMDRALAMWNRDDACIALGSIHIKSAQKNYEQVLMAMAIGRCAEPGKNKVDSVTMRRALIETGIVMRLPPDTKFDEATMNQGVAMVQAQSGAILEPLVQQARIFLLENLRPMTCIMEIFRRKMRESADYMVPSSADLDETSLVELLREPEFTPAALARILSLAEIVLRNLAVAALPQDRQRNVSRELQDVILGHVQRVLTTCLSEMVQVEIRI